MFFRILLAVSIFITSFHICEAAEKVTVEESTLTKDEIRMFKSIAKFDKNFHYSKKARRYFTVQKETQAKTPILVELVFESEGNHLYFDEYIGYGVSFEPDSSIVNYEFDGGTGNRGQGTVMVLPKTVVQTEWSCGVTACILQVKKNGKVVYKETQEQKY